MYWFRIFYYEKISRRVVPVYPYGYNDETSLFRVYAETPEQAAEMAYAIMASDPQYHHHLDRILALSAKVDDCDYNKWRADHYKAM